MTRMSRREQFGAIAFIVAVLAAVAPQLIRPARASVSERQGVLSSGAKASTSTTPVALFAAPANGAPTMILGLTAYNTDTVVHLLTITDSSGSVLRVIPIPSATSTTDYGAKVLTEADNVTTAPGKGVSFFVDAAGVTTSTHVSAQASQGG